MPYPKAQPLPADFNVVPIAPPKRKPPGKPKGAVSKITRDVKQGILEGAISHGSDGEGTGGLTGYFQMCAARYPKHYMNLLGRMVPLQVNGTGLTSDAPPVAINIIGVPHDTYLSQEDIARSRGEPLPIEHAPQIEHELQPQPEVQSPDEAQLRAELGAMSLKELMALAEKIDADRG